MFGLFKKTTMPEAGEALPGRDRPIFEVSGTHRVLGSSMIPPFAGDHRIVVVGLGCFWGAERVFWQAPGVVTTAVGYAAGATKNPIYDEVCSGKTGHNEVVLVVYDPAKTSLEALIKLFFEAHNPTQGMRQGNDVGTQYRSGIYLDDEGDRAIAQAVLDAYQARLDQAGLGVITTEITSLGDFFYAEEYHQQYLAKNPLGYCGLGGTGVACPVGIKETTAAE